MLLPDGRVHCSTCDRYLNSVLSAKNHVQHVHNRQSVRCLICNKVQSSVGNFRKHVSRRHGISGVRNVLENYGRVMGGEDEEDDLSELADQSSPVTLDLGGEAESMLVDVKPDLEFLTEEEQPDEQD